jgi:hypothetical protein
VKRVPASYPLSWKGRGKGCGGKERKGMEGAWIYTHRYRCVYASIYLSMNVCMMPASIHFTLLINSNTTSIGTEEELGEHGLLIQFFPSIYP